MWILAFFTKNGEPATGITPLPVIRVREIATGALVVNDQNMQETGDGFYAYDFSNQDTDKDYVFRCDAGDNFDDYERYTYGSTGEYSQSMSEIESKVEAIDLRSDLIRKIQTNRLELSDGDTSNWVLYDDDDTTPLLVFSVKDKSGRLIVQAPHTPARRSKAVEL